MRKLLVLFLAIGACSRPKAPTIVPEKAQITAIRSQGIDVTVDLGVDNPNAVDLSARAVTAKVVLDGKHDLGTVTVSRPFNLVARSRSHLVVPLELGWSDLSLLVALGASQRAVPYDVDGTVNVGGETLNLDVPFHLAGTLTHDQLVQATVNSLPRLGL